MPRRLSFTAFQVPHGGDLIAFALGPDLPEGGGAAQGGDQVRCPFGSGTGAAESLAVQGDDPRPVDHGRPGSDPSPQHLIGQIGVQAGEGAAKRRLVS